MNATTTQIGPAAASKGTVTVDAVVQPAPWAQIDTAKAAADTKCTNNGTLPIVDPPQINAESTSQTVTVTDSDGNTTSASVSARPGRNAVT